jgi:S-adenosylmethionine/arginine decarboxylase-like enzyme
MPLHNHLLLNGWTLNAPKEEQFVIDWMRNLVEKIDMKVIQGPYASYVTAEGNRGLTAVVMIETSHIAMHIWDEEVPSRIQFDLYTCGELPTKKILDDMEENLGLFGYTHLVLERTDGFSIEDYTKPSK